MNKSERTKLLSAVIVVSFMAAAQPGAQTLSDNIANGELLELRVGVSGEVVEVLVAPGERVDRGAVLVKLDPGAYQSRLNAAAVVIESLKFQLRLKLDDFDRQQELYEEGSLSTVELQAREFSVKQAKAALALARADHQAANRDLSLAHIMAPISGEIIGVPLVGQRANIENGADVLVRMKADQ